MKESKGLLHTNENKSKEELEKWRSEFWDTRTQGNPEVWLAIKQAIDSSYEDAAEILKVCEITPYWGSLILWLDKFKFHYRLPVAIINDPVKFLPNVEELCAMEEKPEEWTINNFKIRTFDFEDQVYSVSSYTLVSELWEKYKQDIGKINGINSIFIFSFLRSKLHNNFNI